MSNTPVENPSFALTVYDAATGNGYQDNADAFFETASAIKSAIGVLALERAASFGNDIDTYTLSVNTEHYSNGSGLLKDLSLFKTGEGSHAAPLTRLLQLSIVQSDCVATNVLIDYLGGKDAINNGISGDLGVEGLELVTDKLDFPGVDHSAQPFQVGRTTMNALVNYYQAIWSDTAQNYLRAPTQEWHRQLHLQVPKARLLGMLQKDLPSNVFWFHKTGSAVDRRPNEFYETCVDAGVLQVDGRRLYVAAAGVLLRCGIITGNEQSNLEAEFAERNLVALSDLGVSLEKPTAA